MASRAELDEYLWEIRNEVCSRCVERPPGGPPCDPLGKWCGVEHNLAELVEAVHDAHSHWMGPYCESKERHVCDHCPARDTSPCPCPMDQLLVLVVQAVEAVDVRHARRAEGLRRAAALPGRNDPEVRRVKEAFEAAAGTWAGCDWPTKFGSLGLDLNGWTSAEATAAADERRGTAEETDWRAAAKWLARVEQYARYAEDEAAKAVKTAAAGAWEKAYDHARLARGAEYLTSRAMWRGTPTTWQPLLRAVFDAMPRGMAGARVELPASVPG